MEENMPTTTTTTKNPFIVVSLRMGCVVGCGVALRICAFVIDWHDAIRGMQSRTLRSSQLCAAQPLAGNRNCICQFFLFFPSLLSLLHDTHTSQHITSLNTHTSIGGWRVYERQLQVALLVLLVTTTKTRYFRPSVLSET